MTSTFIISALCKCLYITVLKYRFVMQINNPERSCHFTMRIFRFLKADTAHYLKVRFETDFLLFLLFGLFSCDTFFSLFKDERFLLNNKKLLARHSETESAKRETENKWPFFFILFHNFPFTKSTSTRRNPTLTID